MNIRDVLGRPPVHPFPARMAPELAWSYFEYLKPGTTVLDPMVGSGTVLALAQRAKLRTVGFDSDPLAVLLATVWTTPLDAVAFQDAAGRVLRVAHGLLNDEMDVPEHASDGTIAFIRYWFDRRARVELTALSSAIRGVQDSSRRAALWCALSRMIISKSAGVSRAIDLAHSRPHRALARAPHLPFARFESCVSQVAQGTIENGASHGSPASRIRLGDARHLPLRANSVDLIFSSPPYLNAIDYIRCSKFSLVWMGHQVDDLRGVRSGAIGTSAGGTPSQNGISIASLATSRETVGERTMRALARYADDTVAVMQEAGRVLRPRGRVVYVLGENYIRGTHIRTGKIAVAAAHGAGLTLIGRRSRTLPARQRYLPPPSVGSTGNLDLRMSRELVLEFEQR